MAIDYLEIRKLADDGQFKRRLQVAIWREASRLLRLNPAPAPALLAWAKLQLKGPSQDITEAVIRVATTNLIFNGGPTWPDADIQTAVQQVAPDLAGA